MIDIESEVFGLVSREIKAVFADAYVTAEYVQSPPRFPAVSVEEKENMTPLRTLDSGQAEKFADLVYEINIYSNKQTGKKTECKNIRNIIDSQMRAMGFNRISCSSVPNLAEATIFRMVLRYTATADLNKIIYGR